VKVGWSEAINQARAMLAVLERDHPGVLERLREDALAELQGWSDLQVRMVADTSTRPDCTVAGGTGTTRAHRPSWSQGQRAAVGRASQRSMSSVMSCSEMTSLWQGLSSTRAAAKRSRRRPATRLPVACSYQTTWLADTSALADRLPGTWSRYMRHREHQGLPAACVPVSG
jgi:hypothetical protein